MRAFVHCSSTLRAAASGSAASALHGRNQRKVLIDNNYCSLPPQTNVGSIVFSIQDGAETPAQCTLTVQRQQGKPCATVTSKLQDHSNDCIGVEGAHLPTEAGAPGS